MHISNALIVNFKVTSACDMTFWGWNGASAPRLLAEYAAPEAGMWLKFLADSVIGNALGRVPLALCISAFVCGGPDEFVFALD